MGLSPDVFDSMTPAEFVYAQIGYLNRKEAEARMAWEIARFSTYAQISVHADKRKGFPSAEKLFPFPWDEPQKRKKTKELTPAERRERVRQITGK